MRTTRPCIITDDPNRQQETAHQHNRRVMEAILRARAEALQDYKDMMAFERYLAELGDRS
jgi:hypothetical protein